MKTPPFTVIKDTREQDGWTFERFDTRYHTCTGMVLQKLETGDYSLKGMENIFCVERKGSVAELAQNLGKDKYRFFAEIERMKSIKHRDRKSTRLNSSHSQQSRMPSSA